MTCPRRDAGCRDRWIAQKSPSATCVLVLLLQGTGEQIDRKTDSEKRNFMSGKGQDEREKSCWRGDARGRPILHWPSASRSVIHYHALGDRWTMGLRRSLAFSFECLNLRDEVLSSTLSCYVARRQHPGVFALCLVSLVAVLLSRV